MGAGDSEAAKGLQQQIEETVSDLKCKREKLQELKGAKKARKEQAAGGVDASQAAAVQTGQGDGGAAKVSGVAASAGSQAVPGAGEAKPSGAEAEAKRRKWS